MNITPTQTSFEHSRIRNGEKGLIPMCSLFYCVWRLLTASYSQLNGCVFSCFLEASKACDRVKKSMLFTKLLRRGAPGYIVRLLMFWYAHQTMCVRRGGSVSFKFTVSNGVRQGGILSPFLFNVYMDDLSVNLKKCLTCAYSMCSPPELDTCLFCS